MNQTITLLRYELIIENRVYTPHFTLNYYRDHLTSNQSDLTLRIRLGR